MKSPKCNSYQVFSGPSEKQQGAVLIMALLIVALVAGLGIKFASDYQLGLARAEGRWHGAQARAYSFSAEGVAIKILEKDDPSVDEPGEVWGGQMQIPLADSSGELFVIIQDANSRINLNSLVGALDPAKGAEDATRYNVKQRMFIRLLQTLVDPQDKTRLLVPSPAEATAIMEAIVDWVDPDNDPSGVNGAEADYYLSQPDPYQPANTALFRSVEELQMVRGITPAIMNALRPYITVLPSSQALNINTVPAQLFRCINQIGDLTPSSEAQAASMEQAKPSSGHYAQTADIDASIQSAFGSGDVDKDFSVKTDFFWLITQAKVGDQIRTGRSLLQRGTPQFTVVRRDEGY